MSDPLAAVLAAAIGLDWVPVSEAARTVHRTPATVWAWIRRPDTRIPVRRVDHHVYVYLPAVREHAARAGRRPNRSDAARHAAEHGP